MGMRSNTWQARRNDGSTAGSEVDDLPLGSNLDWGELKGGKLSGPSYSLSNSSWMPLKNQRTHAQSERKVEH